MAITRVNIGTLVRADSGNVTPTNPAGIVAGDILVLISGAADNVVETLPAGWTKEIEQNAGANCRLTVAWIRYDGSAGNPLVTHTGGSSVWAVIVAYRGCKSTGDPFSAAQAQPNLAIGTTDTAPTITPLPGDFVIFAAAIGEGGTNNGGVQSLSGWSGANPTFTERADNADPGTGTLLCDGGFADGTSTGGATGSRTVTLASAPQATANGVGALLALTQDAGGASFPQSAMLPLTGLAIPGQPAVAPPIGPASGSDPSAFGIVTPLPVSRFVHPLSLVMAARLFPSPQPYVQPNLTVTYNDAGTGTITLSGSGTASHVHDGTGTGTFTLSGSGTGTSSHSGTGTGTFTLSGSGVDSLVYADSDTGTVTLSGTGTRTSTHTSSGTGTITLSGSGFDSFNDGTGTGPADRGRQGYLAFPFTG